MADLAKWLVYPCQAAGAEPGDVCRVSINGQRNGSGATWSYKGPIEAPTITPSIRCGNSACHFHITGGKFTYCDDHKGQRHG